MNKEELLNNVKKWITLDDEIKELSKATKQKRDEKKIITNTLLGTMKENEIDCFDLAGGNKLIYQKRKSKKILSKKHLLESLKKYLKNDKEAESIGDYILNTREETVNENIRRKNPK